MPTLRTSSELLELQPEASVPKISTQPIFKDVLREFLCDVAAKLVILHFPVTRPAKGYFCRCFYANLVKMQLKMPLNQLRLNGIDIQKLKGAILLSRLSFIFLGTCLFIFFNTLIRQNGIGAGFSFFLARIDNQIIAHICQLAHFAH